MMNWIDILFRVYWASLVGALAAYIVTGVYRRHGFALTAVLCVVPVLNTAACCAVVAGAVVGLYEGIRDGWFAHEYDATMGKPNACNHQPMTYYSDVPDIPRCRRCGHPIVWDNESGTWVERPDHDDMCC